MEPKGGLLLYEMSVRGTGRERESKKYLSGKKINVRV